MVNNKIRLQSIMGGIELVGNQRLATKLINVGKLDWQCTQFHFFLPYRSSCCVGLVVAGVPCFMGM